MAAALVFDISRAATFQSMKKWLNDLREKVSLPDGSSIPVVLLANKCDISVAVTDEQISKFCKENKIYAWYATSAKNNTNVGGWTINLLLYHLSCKLISLESSFRGSLYICYYLENYFISIINILIYLISEGKAFILDFYAASLEVA